MISKSIAIKVLEPGEGKILTNGETYSYKVYLGVNDSEDSWWEVDEAEAWKEPPEYQYRY